MLSSPLLRGLWCHRFNKQAKTAKNKMWMQIMKLNIILGVIGVAILGGIVYKIVG